MMEQCAERRIAVRIVAAFEHPIHRVIKVLARGFQVSSLEIVFAGGELLLHPLD